MRTTDERIRDLRRRDLRLPAAYEMLDHVERHHARQRRRRVPRAARPCRPLPRTSRLEDVAACVLILVLLALACLA